MNGQTIGGYSPQRTQRMNELYDRSRKNRPRCFNCEAKLAYDRAADDWPCCGACHRKLIETGQTPTQLINRQRGIAAARTRNSGGHKLPNLRAIREARAISKTALAERAGIDHHTVSNIELRDSMATPKTIAGLTKALEVSELELRGET